jgi:hypothetical protein|tara:strand:- start:11544 stop:11858 length:315 start_codon:yes stop_codon:yes gene_type:complete
MSIYAGSSIEGVATNVTTETKTIQSGRTRVYGVYLDSGAAAGDFHLRDGGSGGTVKFKCKAPAQIGPITINFPVPILFKTDVYANFTTEHVIAATVFHSGGANE